MRATDLTPEEQAAYQARLVETFDRVDAVLDSPAVRAERRRANDLEEIYQQRQRQAERSRQAVAPVPVRPAPVPDPPRHVAPSAIYALAEAIGKVAAENEMLADRLAVAEETIAALTARLEAAERRDLREALRPRLVA